MKNAVSRRSKRRHFHVEPLEGRVLFSAGGPLAIALSHQQTVAPVLHTATISTVSWVGGTTGDWNTTSNWSDNAVPTTTDSVSVPSGVTVTISTGAQSVDDLQCEGSLTMTGGSLTLANASTIQGNLNISTAALTANGTLTLGGTATISSGSQSIAGLQCNGSLSITGGSLTLSAASTFEETLGVTNATLTANAAVTLIGTSTFEGATIAGSGALSQSFEQSITISGSTMLSGTISSGGTITISAGGSLTVSGTYTQTGFGIIQGSASLPGSLTIANGGAFNWDGGSVTGLSGFTSEAGSTVSLPNGGALDSTTWDNYVAVALPSGLSFSNGAILNNHQSASLNLTGSGPTVSLSGSGTLNNDGSILAGTGNGGTAVTISIGFNSSSTGTIEDASGSLSIFGNGTSDAIWTADANGEIIFGGTLTMQSDTAWNGTGLYSVTGDVTLSAGGSLTLENAQVSGSLGGAGNLTLVNVQVTGSLGGAGNLTVPSGGVLLVAPGNSVNAATLLGPGSLTIDSGGTLNFGNGPVSDIQLSDPIVNNGAIYVNAQYVFFMSGGSLINNNTFEAQTGPTTTNGGVLTFGSGTDTSEANYNSVITNNGSFQVDSALGGLNIYGQLNNDGTFTILGGPVQIVNGDAEPPGVSDGIFSVASGASLTFEADQTFNAGVILEGTGSYNVSAALTLNAPSIDLSPYNFTLEGYGVLAGSGAFTVTNGSTFTFNGGATLELSGAFEIQSGGVLNFPTSTTAIISGTTITNDGTINFEPGMATTAVNFLEGATLTNEADGTVNMLFAQSAGGGLFQDDGTGTINNLGLLVFQGSAAQFVSTLLNVSTFNNPGTLEIESGELDLGGTVSQISTDQTTLTGGTWDVINGSTLVFDSIDLSGSGVSVTTNEAKVSLSGAGASFNAVGNLSFNSGGIGLIDGATLASGVGMSSGGGGGSVHQAATGFQTNDIVDGPLTNSGTIEVGLGSSLDVTGNYVQTTAGKLVVDVAGDSASGDFGQVTIAGTATLAGTLDVQLQNGFVPTLGDSYSILTYAGASGNFTAFTNVSPQFSAALGSAAYTLTVQSTNLPDLVTSAVAGQASAIAGQNLTVTYTVTNSGSAAASGSWMDSVYLSPGTTFDPTTAVLLGNVQHSGGLGVGDSYSGSLTALTPGLIPGNYTIIVVADSLEQINDLNRANNIGDSITPEAVSAPMLTLGAQVTGTLANGQEQLYELDLQGNSQVVVTLSSAVAAGAEIYESYNAQPTLASFDQTAFNVSGETESLAITGDQPGPYYILVRGTAASGTGAAFTLEAQTSNFGVTAVSPTAGTGVTTITLTGSELAADDTVTLVPSSGTGASLAASTVYSTSNTSLSATFNLAGIAAGTAYDVQVSNGSTVATLPTGFTVGSPVNAAVPVVVSITAPQFVRTGENYSILVNYTNESNEDQPAPLITLSATNALLELSDSVVFASGTIAFLATDTSGGPAGILPPGYEGSISVEVEQTVNQNHTTMAYSYSLADPSLAMNYTALVPYLDSQNYTPTQWTAVWNEVQKLLGSTQAGYLQALSADATLLPTVQGNNTDPIQDLEITLAQAQADITTSIQGKITAASPGLSLGGSILIATNTSTDQTYGTYVLNDGSFALPDLAAGSYSLTLDGALLGSSTTLAVAANQQLTGVALTATAGDTLVGVTTNAANGSILAGATVDAFGANGEVYSTVSGANGQYSIAGLPSDTYTIIANAPGAAQLVDEGLSIGSAGMLLNLSLAQQATITGTIAPATNPTTGNTPLVFAETPGNTDPNLVYYATPDGTGGFTLANLPAGTYDVTVSLNGYVTSQTSNVTVATGGTQSIGAVNLTAEGGITGAVSSSDPNTPAAGLLVGAYQNGALIASANANSGGNYAFSDLAPGSYQIEPIGYPYFANDPTVLVAAGQTAAAPVLALQPGGVISGTVTNLSSNVPLVGLTVDATNASGTTVVAYVDANGEYTFNNLALGSYQIFLGLSGANASTTVTVSTLNPTPVTANLQAAVTETITGQLFLANGVTPVVGGVVTLLQSGQAVATSTTDSNGNYAFLLQQGGTFSLQAAGGNASFAQVNNLVVSTGQNVTQNFVAGSGAIALTITDSTQAVAGSTVNIYQASSNIEVASTTLGANGQLTVNNLSDGNYSVVVVGANNRGAQAMVTVSGGDTASMTVAQQAQATVSGTLTDSSTGNPISGGTVTLYSTTNPALTYTAPVGANGEYTISNVAVGQYDTVATSNDYDASLAAMGLDSGPTDFNLPLNADKTTKLTGTILNQSGAPIPYAFVTVVNSSNQILGEAYANQNGVFLITGVTGSNLTLQVTVGNNPQLNTLQVSPESNETTDVGPVTAAFPAAGMDNQGSSLFSMCKAAIQNIQSYISTLFSISNGGFLQSYIDQVQQFTGTPASFPTFPSCPDCKGAYQTLETAVNYQRVALQFALEAQMKTVADANDEVTTFYKEALTNFGTVFTTALTALQFIPAVAVFLKASAAAGIASNVLGLAQSSAAFANDAISSAQLLQNAQLGGSVAPSLADKLNQGTQDTLDIVGFIAAVKSICLSGPSASVANSLNILSIVTGLATGGASSLTYTSTNMQAAELMQDAQKFIDYREKFYTADATAKQAQNEFNDCLAKSSMGCGNKGQGGGGGTSSSSSSSMSLNGHDPNDLYGPAGYGPQNFIQATLPLAYRIDFENDPNASAPTAVVSITETLDPNLNLSTFQLGDFGFGGMTVDVPAGLTSYQTTVDDTAATGLDVEVNASLDVQTRTVTWTFTSIDPQTGQPPSNPLSGFLPPDVNAPEGLGFVTYTANAQSGLATGTVISAQASVVFDANAAIATPVFTNTIDAAAPTSTIKALPAHEAPDFTLQWSGVDDALGSGLASYSVYESVNNGAYQPFLLNTTSTAAVFDGTIGDTYSFYVVAADNAGNVELAPNSPEATTTIVAPQTFTVTSKKAFTFTDAEGRLVTVKLTGPGSVVGTLDAGVANDADLRSLVLSDTTASSALSVTVAKNLSTEITEISTAGADESLGSLTLGSNVILGDGLDDGTVALDLDGSLKSLSLGEIAAYDQIDLGSGLTGVPLAKEAPAFAAGSVLGAGVAIEATGGLGAVKLASWDFAGSLDATLGVGNVTVTGALEANISSSSLGNLTAGSLADSAITIAGGNVGDVATLGGTIKDVSISAASGKIGNITAAVAKQTGSVIGIDAVTLTAKSIGNVTATVADAVSLVDSSAIVGSQFTATAGNIGAVTADVSGALTTAVGIDTTAFSASGSIGNVTVKAASSAAAESIAGISGSTFTAGGALGNLSVSAAGGAKQPDGGSATGVTTSDGAVTFSAGTTIGHINVTAAGAGGSNEGLAGSANAPIDFSAGQTIAAITVSASESKAAGSGAFALSDVTVTAGGAIGAVLIEGKATATQATALNLIAGGSLAGLTIESSGNASFGSLADSVILAGQSVTLHKNSDLTKAGIGFVTVSGSLLGDTTALDSTIGAVGSIGAVTVGGEMSDFSLVAGFNASAGGVGSPGDDSFNDNASIASVKVGGQFVDSSIVAGIDPGSDQKWGLSTNVVGSSATGLTAKSKIGAVKLGVATLTGTVTNPFPSGATEMSDSAIESLQLTSVQIGTLKPLTSFTTAHWIDANGDGTQEADETLIQTL